MSYFDDEDSFSITNWINERSNRSKTHKLIKVEGDYYYSACGIKVKDHETRTGYIAIEAGEMGQGTCKRCMNHKDY